MIAKRMDNVRQLLKPFNLNRLRSKVLSRKSKTRQAMQTANKTRILCRGMKSPKRRRGTPRKIPAISIHRTSFIGIILTLIVQNSGICPLTVFRSTSSKFLTFHACYRRNMPCNQNIRIHFLKGFFDYYRLRPVWGVF